jgi:hypothetical protein
MRRWPVLLACLVIILIAIWFLWTSEWLTIDACLDSGGRWNYQAKACEH